MWFYRLVQSTSHPGALYVCVGNLVGKHIMSKRWFITLLVGRKIYIRERLFGDEMFIVIVESNK